MNRRLNAIVTMMITFIIMFSIVTPVSAVSITSYPYGSQKIEITVGETKFLDRPWLFLGVICSSSNSDVVRVSNTGIITGIRKGTAVVTVSGSNFKDTILGTLMRLKQLMRKTYTIVVKEAEKEGKESLDIIVGESLKIDIGDVSGKTVKWSSSDISVAAVDNDGVVRGIREGSAKISANITAKLSKFSFWGLLGLTRSKSVVKDYNVRVLSEEQELETEEFTVTFDSNGGTEIEPQIIQKGRFATMPESPKKAEFTFDGWYLDSSFSKQFDFSTIIQEDIILFAKWIPVNGTVVPDKIEFGLGEDKVDDYSFVPEEPALNHESINDEVEKITKLNNDEFPYVETDENGSVSFIDGRFSDIMVRSADDAINALNDIHYIMNFENAKQEFEEVSTQTVSLGEATKFYRLQQVYHNIPVYGYNIIVSTNEEGQIRTLSGHYYPGINLETEPRITYEEAKNRVIEQTDAKKVISDGLCIYVSESAALCWKIKSLQNDYFVDANTGELIDTISNIMSESLTGEGVTLTGNNVSGQHVSFPVSFDGEKYLLCDPIRNISVRHGGYKEDENVSTGNLCVSEDNNWANYSADISAYTNMIKTYDYYTNVLGRNGADDNHKMIVVSVDFRENKNQAWYNAAFYPDAEEFTFIGIGVADMFSASLDVLAHEYTHSVTNATWGGIYSGESGALNEAYSDIIGDLIEDRSLAEIGENLQNGAIRSFENPEKYGQPSHYSDYKYFGDVHYNSGIINHAAYLMDQRWPTDNHADELATLFYKSMGYLSPNSNFLDCRRAVLASAKSLNMSYEKKK